MTIAELRTKVDAELNESTSFFAYAEELIAQLKAANHYGTARSYKGVISVLKEYCNNRDLQFRDITFSFLTKFETTHFSKGNSVNGLSVYM